MAQKQLQGTQVDEGTLVLSGVDGTGVTNVDAVSLNTFVLGSGANNIVQLDGASRLPIVSGVQLTDVLHDIIADVSPQLGGSLDTNGFNLITPGVVSAINAQTITLKPGSNTYISGGFSAGNVNIFGGQGTSGNVGGDISLSPGSADSSNDYGTIQLHAPENKTGQAILQFWNDTNVGHTTGNSISLAAPATVVDRTWYLPDDDPAASNGFALVTDTSGNLRFADSFVRNTGDIMSGDLTISKATPIFKLARSLDAEQAFVRFGAIDDGFSGSGYMGIPAGSLSELRVNSYHGDVVLRADNGGGIATVGTDGNVSVSAATPSTDDDLTRKDYVDTRVRTGRWFLNSAGPSISGANFTGATTTYISTGRYRLTFALGSNWTATFQQEFNSSVVYNIIIRVRASTYLEIEIRDSATGALVAGNEAVNFMIMVY